MLQILFTIILIIFITGAISGWLANDSIKGE